MLIVDVDDDRSSLTLKIGSKTVALDFSPLVTEDFCSIGRRVEWRLNKRASSWIPNALIARVVFVQPDKTDGEYLVVAKLSGDKSCVVAKVDARKIKHANEKARESADKISDQSPCPGR